MTHRLARCAWVIVVAVGLAACNVEPAPDVSATSTAEAATVRPLPLPPEWAAAGVGGVASVVLPPGVVPASLQLTSREVVFADRATMTDEQVGPRRLVWVDVATGVLRAASATTPGAGIASLAAYADRTVWVETTPDRGPGCSDDGYGCYRWRLLASVGGGAASPWATSQAAAPARGVPVPRTNEWGTCWAESTDATSWTSTLKPVEGEELSLASVPRWVRWCEPARATDAFLGEWTITDSSGRGTITSSGAGAEPVLVVKDGVDARVSSAGPLWTVLVDPENGTREVSTPSSGGALARGEVYLATWADSHHVMVSSSTGVELIDVRSGRSVLLTSAVDSTAKVAAGDGRVAYVDSESPDGTDGLAVTVLSLEP